MVMRIDQNSATWSVVRDWAENQRQGYIEQLIGGANPDMDERIRGRIQVLDALLALPNDP